MGVTHTFPASSLQAGRSSHPPSAGGSSRSARRWLGQVCTRVKKHMRPIAILVVLALCPMVAQAQEVADLVQSGRAKHESEDWAGAIADFTRAIEIDPGSSVAYNGRGKARSGAKDYDGALADFAKAIELAPGDAEIYCNRGYTLYDLGRWAESAEDLIQACTLGKRDSSSTGHAHLRLWCSRARMGEAEEALRELRDYVQSLTDAEKKNQQFILEAVPFLSGEMSETEYIDLPVADLGSRESRTIACYRCFYAGTKCLIEGDAAHARSLFRRGLETGASDAAVYSAMRAELAPGRDSYALEDEIYFNVLTGASIDPETGAVTLVGFSDPRFRGPTIPYLRHLATLLEHPRPQFSLRWTPESEAKVDDLLRRLDSPDEVRRLAASWGQVLDDNGRATAAGRHFLPLWGVRPTDNGAAPGTLEIEADVNERAQLRVTAVLPGSAAERVGLRAGDVLMMLNDQQPYHVDELHRFLCFTGAGAPLKMMVNRPGEGSLTLTTTLDASSDDLWAHVDRYDIVQRILLASDMKEASWIVRAMGVWHRVQGSDQAVLNRALMDILVASAGFELYIQLQNQVSQSEISPVEATARSTRAICEGMDRHFGLEGGPILRTYEQALAQGQSAESAIDVALVEMNRQLPGVLEKALYKLWAKYDEIEISPEVVLETLGTRPQVVPEFEDVDPTSPLADVLLRADYFSKNLFHLPKLAEQIPAYQTEFAFDRAHPDQGGAAGAATSHHLWISVASLDLARSQDGNTLEIRDARMRINIREKAPGGGDLPVEAGGYGELLTSIYDDLAAMFPVYHELRECAKLTAVAQWLKTRRPDFRLPAPREKLLPPSAALPGTVYMTWTPNPDPGKVTASIMAVGGVTLVLPFPREVEGEPSSILSLAPEDASVVPLTGDRLVVMPEVYNNEALAKVLRHKIEVPPPRPVGWVASATKGERTLQALTVLPPPEGVNPEESIRVQRKLEEARENAFRLAEVERAINVLTSQNPARQAEFKEMDERLTAARDRFIQSSVSIVTQRLWDMHDLIREKDLGSGPLAAMNRVADDAREAKSVLDELQEKLTKIEQGLKIAGGNREEAIASLTELAKEIVTKADPRALSPMGKVLFPVRRTLAAQDKLKDVVGLGTSMFTLEQIRREMQGAGDRTDAELAALRDRLLPLQRELSDRQDRLMKDPDLKRLTKGQ